MDDGSEPDKLQRLVDSAVNPVQAYRRQICHRLVKQSYNQFGIDGLLDLLGGIDMVGRFSSVVIIDRDEIDNYLFNTYGSFDPDMFEKVQLTQEWDDFIVEVMDRAGATLGKIVDGIVASEKA